MDHSQNKTIFDQITSPYSVGFSIDGLSKGIDNYHVDVKLSKRFSSDVKKLIALLVQQMAVPSPKHWDNSRHFEKLRESYLDLMTVLIHRVKTDLTQDHVIFLQLAIIKYILGFTNSQLDTDIRQLSAKLSDLRNRGSSEALATDQRLFWLKKNRDSIIYHVNKHVVAQIQRVEERELKAIREQFLGEEFSFSTEIILNPMLYSPELSNLSLLVGEYSPWDLSNDDTSFSKLDAKFAEIFSSYLDPFESPALNVAAGKPSSTEIHDEMGGFFKTRNLLGPSEDCKNDVRETIVWLEDERLIQLLLNKEKTQAWLKSLKAEHGFFSWWKARKDVKRIETAVTAFIKYLKKEKQVTQLIAASSIRKATNPLILEKVDIKALSQFLTGRLSIEKLQESSGSTTKLNVDQLRLLEQLKGNIAAQAKNFGYDEAVIILAQMGRYRRHLKLYRLAHRAFNRLSILSEDDDIKLSKVAGTLNLLPVSSEVEDADAKICHHAILKADVRGSTTVTDELMNKGLNPASYFSMRFFNPINKILETYGANKVFIEGDAIILSFLEYEHAPEQWFAVARACGYAKDMLQITGSNNRYSTQMGLPLLELGVGICFSDEAPRFLYDGDHPIMISGAIGLADRMSGCSWNLRAAIKKSLFNVNVLRIADGDFSKGEKGQLYVRYNVNGINIDDLAFSKLKDEIAFKTVKLKLNGEDYLFHVGQYPDTQGRKKDLIIREGKVGIWANNEILSDPDATESYYEVVVNRKVIPHILESIGTKKLVAA